MTRKKSKNKHEEFPMFSRDLSWVEFNARVLEQGLNPDNALLERLKFLAIVSSNFDEFFMVRMAGYKRMQAAGDERRCPAGCTPTEILEEASARIQGLVAEQQRCYVEELRPSLAEAGLLLLDLDDYDEAQKRAATEVFDRAVF